jgi:hypothetical protein
LIASDLYRARSCAQANHNPMRLVCVSMPCAGMTACSGEAQPQMPEAGFFDTMLAPS